MSKKYMMDVYDVMEELGVSKSKAYQILRELNTELVADGFKAYAGKIPRPYWGSKFFGYAKSVG